MRFCSCNSVCASLISPSNIHTFPALFIPRVADKISTAISCKWFIPTIVCYIPANIYVKFCIRLTQSVFIYFYLNNWSYKCLITCWKAIHHNWAICFFCIFSYDEKVFSCSISRKLVKIIFLIIFSYHFFLSFFLILIIQHQFIDCKKHQHIWHNP